MLTTEWGPVGTRGGCGAGWGPGACPGGNAIQWGLRGAQRSHPNQDKHKAPSSTPPRPLSLQDPGPQAPQWIGLPDLVVKIHQVARPDLLANLRQILFRIATGANVQVVRSQLRSLRWSRCVHIS